MKVIIILPILLKNKGQQIDLNEPNMKQQLIKNIPKTRTGNTKMVAPNRNGLIF